MSHSNSDLPHVDEHRIGIAASRDLVWESLQHYVATALLVRRADPLARMFRTEPREGFRVSESVPGERLTLVGRHRFSRYLLSFELADAAGGTAELRAHTDAAFPGVGGRAYRAAVIGTRAHAFVVRRILRSVRRLSEEGRGNSAA